VKSCRPGLTPTTKGEKRDDATASSLPNDGAQGNVHRVGFTQEQQRQGGIDRAPKGRNETGVWWRRNDEYDKR
jgi:hypothetical protein